MFARVFTSVGWGIFADRYGRKPVLLIGCFFMYTFLCLFLLLTDKIR
jgi:MFS family permease